MKNKCKKCAIFLDFFSRKFFLSRLFIFSVKMRTPTMMFLILSNISQEHYLIIQTKEYAGFAYFEGKIPCKCIEKDNFLKNSSEKTIFDLLCYIWNGGTVVESFYFSGKCLWCLWKLKPFFLSKEKKKKQYKIGDF